jgi:hypothetical protein
VLNRPAGEGGDGVWALLLDAWQCAALGPPPLAGFEAAVLARVAAEQTQARTTLASPRSALAQNAPPPPLLLPPAPSWQHAATSRTARRFVGFLLRRGRQARGVDSTATAAATPAAGVAADVSARLPPFSSRFLLAVTRAAAAAATAAPSAAAARAGLEAQWLRAETTLRDAQGSSSSSNAPSRHGSVRLDPAALRAARAQPRHAEDDTLAGRSAPRWSGGRAFEGNQAASPPLVVFSCGHVVHEARVAAAARALDGLAAASRAASSAATHSAAKQRSRVEAGADAQRLAACYRARPVLGAACPGCSGAAALLGVGGRQ